MSITDQIINLMKALLPVSADDEQLRDEILSLCAAHWKIRESDRMTEEQLRQALRCGLALAKTAAEALGL